MGKKTSPILQALHKERQESRKKNGKKGVKSSPKSSRREWGDVGNEWTALRGEKWDNASVCATIFSVAFWKTEWLCVSMCRSSSTQVVGMIHSVIVSKTKVSLIQPLFITQMGEHRGSAQGYNVVGIVLQRQHDGEMRRKMEEK